MNVYLFDITDDPRNLEKSIPAVLPAPIDAKLQDAIAYENPVILIESPIINANYAYIPDLGGRYYYITEIVQVRKNLAQIHLQVDVLQTYRTAIKAAPIFATRTAKEKAGGVDIGYSAYLHDPQQPVLVPTREDVHEMGAFEWGSEILITMG